MSGRGELRVAAGRRSFDPSGHYSRPDILQLHVTV